MQSVQVCVKTMPRRKDISNDLREEIVAAYLSGKCYKVISKQFEVYTSTVRKIIHKLKTFKAAFQEWTSQKFDPKLGLCHA